MPGLDRTGPDGKGAKTGRGLGKCKPSKSSQVDNKDENYIGRRRDGSGRGRSGGGSGRGKRDGSGGGQGRNRS